MDNVIASREFQVERKRLTVEFRENERGRFLRTGLNDFTAAIDEVVIAASSPTPA